MDAHEEARTELTGAAAKVRELMTRRTTIDQEASDRYHAALSEGARWLKSADKANVLRDIHRELSTELQRDLDLSTGTLQSVIGEWGPAIEATERQVQEPASLPQAVRQRTGHDLSSTDELLIALLADSYERGFGPALQLAPPTAQRDTYERALDDPTEPRNAFTIATVERLVTSGRWVPEASDLDPSEMAAVSALKRRVGEVRAARVPQDVRDLLTLVSESRTVLQRARTAAGAIPTTQD
jgi:hypothetical protein